MTIMTIPTCIELGLGDVAVFLLHGVGGRAGAWDLTMPALADEGFRCIAWDAPGYGNSAMVEPYTTQSLAHALLALIDSVGAKRNVILGHSMGGLIAQEAVALRATGIHGLILFSTSAAFGKPGGDWQQQFLASRFAPLDAGLGMAGLAPALVKGMVAPGSHADAAGVLAAVKLMGSVPKPPTAPRWRRLCRSTEFPMRATNVCQGLATLATWKRPINLTPQCLPF